MRRRTILVLAGALWAAAAAGAPPLLADGDGEPKKDPKDTQVGKVCNEIGGNFQDKDSDAVVGRVRDGAKLYLALGAKGDSYGAKQAKVVLDKWFEDKKGLKLELTSVSEMTGKFKISWREGGTDKRTEKTLCITVERVKGEGFHLTKLELL
jgi:hypothetical protein